MEISVFIFNLKKRIIYGEFIEKYNDFVKGEV